MSDLALANVFADQLRSFQGNCQRVNAGTGGSGGGANALGRPQGGARSRARLPTGIANPEAPVRSPDCDRVYGIAHTEKTPGAIAIRATPAFRHCNITADSGRLASPLHVTAGLVPAIHVFLCSGAPESKTWMPATSAGMTAEADSI